MTPPKNQYFDAAAKMIDGYDGGASGVREGAMRNVNAINEAAAGNSFYGGNTSPELRDKIKESRLFRNNMDLGRGLAEAKQNEIGYKNSAFMSLGGATAPQLVQTGGNMTGTQSGGFWGDMATSAAGGMGSAVAA